MKIDATTRQAVIDNSKFYPVLNDLKKSGEPCTKPDLRMVKVQLSNGKVASITLRVTDGLTVCKIRPSFENGQYRQRKQAETTYAEFSAVTSTDMFERLVTKVVKVATQMGVVIGLPKADTETADTETAETETTETETTETETTETETADTTTVEDTPFKMYLLFHFKSGNAKNVKMKVTGDTILTEDGQTLQAKDYIFKPIDE